MTRRRQQSKPFGDLNCRSLTFRARSKKLRAFDARCRKGLRARGSSGSASYEDMVGRRRKTVATTSNYYAGPSTRRLTADFPASPDVYEGRNEVKMWPNNVVPNHYRKS